MSCFSCSLGFFAYYKGLTPASGTSEDVKDKTVPIDLLIYITVAAVLVIWLRNTLGTRNGEERDRSEEFENRIKPAPRALENIRDIIDIESPEKSDDLKTVPANLVEDMRELLKTDPDFNVTSFVDGAKEAFAIIVESFAKGDTRTLKDLLSPGVYSAFAQAIQDREGRGETNQTEIHSVRSAEIVGITRLDRMAFIKLRFIATETCVIRDRQGTIISGNPDKVTTMNDVWTFGRDVRAKDPTWFLYETSDDTPEEVKTSIPDASSAH